MSFILHYLSADIPGFSPTYRRHSLKHATPLKTFRNFAGKDSLWTFPLRHL
jgi:hypothetical protein